MHHRYTFYFPAAFSVALAVLAGVLVILVVFPAPPVLGQSAHKTSQRVACSGGTAGVYSCNETDLMSVLTPAELGASTTCSSGKRLCGLNDMWGWTDPQSGREYAIVGREDGTAFVDVTDPVAPIYLGNLPHNGLAPSAWRDMKVYADRAYIVADGQAGNGVQVFDLTQLRGLSGPPVEFQMTGLYSGVGTAHNIAIDEDTGFAYVTGYRNATQGGNCGKGLLMLDLSDPDHPTYAGCFAFPGTGLHTDGYSHDAQCVLYHGPDLDYQGHEMCFGLNETAITIADVTDKANPIAVSAASYPQVHYVHQGWLTEDQKYLFQGDELDERTGDAPNTRTMIWDVVDLDDPVLLTTHDAAGTAIDHNMYVDGKLLYQSNYIDGLRILDISDPGSPVEIAYFDTYSSVPANPHEFSGSWSNYPFFASGTIAVTDRTGGLFLVQSALAQSVATETPEVPGAFVVSSAFPDPFQDQFTILLEVPKTQFVNIAIFDLLGRRLQRVFSGSLTAGHRQQIAVDLADFPTGTYFYRVTGDEFVLSKPITHAR